MSRDIEDEHPGPRVKKNVSNLDDPSQSSDQVQESAQALIQLAQGGLGYAEGGHEDTSPSVEIHPNSQLTAQQVINAKLEKIQARKVKGRRKRQARVEGRVQAAKAIAALTVHGRRSDAKRQNHEEFDDFVSGKRRSDDLTLPTSSHPLDDVSTDDEVQNIEAGAAGFGTTFEDLPSYTSAQRQDALQELFSDQNQVRKRRKPNLRSKKSTTGINTDPDKALPSVENSENEGNPSVTGRTLPSPECSVSHRKDQAPCSPPLVTEFIIDPNLETNAHGRDSTKITRSREYKENNGISETPQTTSTIKRPRKRTQRRTKVNARGRDHTYVSPYPTNVLSAGSQAPAHAYYELSRFAGDQPVQNDSSSHAGDAGNSSQGHFGQVEVRKLELFRDRWCETNAGQPSEFNELVQTNLRNSRSATELFDQIKELFPQHKQVYIQRFCRRKFHNFTARGTWTADEDEKLRHAVAEKGTAWKRVGQMINRFPEDCRDRWRNYVSTPDRRNHDMWTEGEMRSLARCIFDCFCENFIDHWERTTDMTGYFPPPAPDLGPDTLDMKMINWQTVSDSMLQLNLRRTRLQCSSKWSKIRQPEQRRLLCIAQEDRQTNRDTNIDQDENYTEEGTGWRSMNAKKQAQKMLEGDKIDLLEAVLETGARTEQAIPWNSVGQNWFQGRWTAGVRKAAWLALRRSLQAAEGDDYRFVARLLLERCDRSKRDERYDVAQATHLPKKGSSKKRSVPDVLVDGSNLYGESPNGNANHPKDLHQRPEVIEINSDDEVDEYGPNFEANHSNSSAMTDPTLNSQHQAYNQIASFNASLGHPSSNHHDEAQVETSMTPSAPVADSDLSPQLTRRLLDLQNA